MPKVRTDRVAVAVGVVRLRRISAIPAATSRAVSSSQRAVREHGGVARFRPATLRGVDSPSRRPTDDRRNQPRNRSTQDSTVDILGILGISML